MRPWLPTATALLVVAACGGEPESFATAQSRDQIVATVPQSVSPARLRSHLVALQRIADEHGGTRVAGSPGYAASVRYVREALVRAGYRPQVLPFPFVEYIERREVGRQLAPLRRAFRIEAIDYSPSTPRRGVRGRVVRSGVGCSRRDFAGARGRIAIVERGVCFLSLKARNARAAGALALLTFDPAGELLDGTTGDPYAAKIPVAGVSARDARALARTRALVSLQLLATRKQSTSSNVVADSVPGAARVLVVGAHLDSVRAGPGINDNGTGVAALLETARAVRREAPRLAVRFAFWGGEESGLIGSRAYVSTVPRSELAGYLNFDMLGTRGGSREVYVGRYADRWLAYFDRRGVPAKTINLTGRSDNFSFELVGVPTGGLFAGINACYHKACDRLSTVDLRLFHTLAAGVAYGVAAFAPLAR